MRSLAVLLCLILGLSLGLSLAPRGATARPSDAPAPGFRLPVDGRVVAHFDAPPHTFAAGHRGVDLAAAPGAVVRAAGPGRVRFAAAVAGERWVTVDHGGGLVTSYGALGRLDVVAGEEVTGGSPLGTVATAHGRRALLHWGARRDGDYIDPLSLLAPTWVPTLVGPGGWTAGDVPDIPRYGGWDGQHRFGLVPSSPAARGPGYVLAPNPNHVISIAGLGSRTGEPALDVTHLGYAPEDVTGFSYAGAGPDGAPRPYDPADTWRGVEAAAERLRDELRRRWAASPGQAVDLVGHSMGGVVAMYYVLVLHDPADPTLPPIGHVATVASPLEGTDVAAALVGGRRDPWMRPLLDAIDRRVERHDLGAQAIDDLVPGSPVVGTVTDGWRRAGEERWAGPLATGTRVLTIGASQDPVVMEHRSDLPGADHIVAPGTHDGVRTTEASRLHAP